MALWNGHGGEACRLCACCCMGGCREKWDSFNTDHKKKEVKYLLFILKEQMSQLQVQLLEA